MKKMTALCLMLAILLLFGGCLAEGWTYPARFGEKYGAINERGEMVIEPTYDYIGEFRGAGYAYMRMGELEGIIDKEGHVILKPFAYADQGYDGYYYGGKDTGVIWFYDMKNDTAGYFDVMTGRFSGMQYDVSGSLFMIDDKMIGVTDVQSGLLGYVNRQTGELVIPYQYDSWNSGTFSEGFAYVCLPGENDEEEPQDYLMIDETGNQLLPPAGTKITTRSRFSEGLCAVEDECTGLIGFMDAAGALVIEPKYTGAYGFSEGCCAVLRDGRWLGIDKAGNEIIDPRFDTGFTFHGGVACVNEEKGFMVMRPDGWYDFAWLDYRISDFSEAGRALFIPLDTPEDFDFEPFGIVDRQGNVLLTVDAGYGYAIDYSFGWDRVYASDGMQRLYHAQSEKYGFIDVDGNITIPCVYDYADQFSHGLVQAELNGKMRYLNPQGQTVWTEP